MRSRSALARICALGLVAAGAMDNHPGAPAGPVAARAQTLPPAAPPTLVVPPLAELQPPAIQLRFGAALYDGVRGSYCWTPTAAPGAAPVPGLCADVLPPTFDRVLTWPAGEPLEFMIDGPAPSALTLTVYSKPNDPLVLQAELPLGTSAIWQPTVAPGAYLLGVAARWPQGDVTYFFPVGIPPAGAPSATAPAEPEFAPTDGVLGPAGPGAPRLRRLLSRRRPRPQPQHPRRPPRLRPGRAPGRAGCCFATTSRTRRAAFRWRRATRRRGGSAT